VKKVLIIAVTIVAMIALGNVVLASAQVTNQPGPQNGTCPASGYTCPFSGTTQMGRGMMGDHGMMGGRMMGANGMHEQVMTAVAKQLGLTYAELNTAMQSGQTVVQLAQAKGVSLAALKTVALDAMKASFADLVKQGAMTQAQADAMVDHMDDMPMFNFEQGTGGMMNGMMGSGRVPGGMMGGGRGGMMRGYQQPAGPQG
jgi:hypothetical protein